jgi:hypothetical protein
MAFDKEVLGLANYDYIFKVELLCSYLIRLLDPVHFFYYSSPELGGVQSVMLMDKRL